MLSAVAAVTTDLHLCSFPSVQEAISCHGRAGPFAADAVRSVYGVMVDVVVQATSDTACASDAAAIASKVIDTLAWMNNFEMLYPAKLGQDVDIMVTCSQLRGRGLWAVHLGCEPSDDEPSDDEPFFLSAVFDDGRREVLAVTKKGLDAGVLAEALLKFVVRLRCE